MRHELLPALASLALLAACGDDAAPAIAPDASGDTTPDSAADVGDDAAPETPDTDDETSADATDPDTSPELDASPDTEVPVLSGFCEGATTFAWDPDDGDSLAAFPDDALTVDDPAALTGLRVTIGNPAWLDDEPQFFKTVWRQLEGLDGFGTSAGVVLRFSAPIAEPPSGSTSIESDAIALLDLGTSPPTRVPFEAEVLEEGKTIILWPMRPLREQTLHAAVMTTSLTDADGGCVSPSAPLRALLSPERVGALPASLARLKGRFATLLAALDAEGLAPGDVSAATVFTTQAVSAPTLAQREHLLAQPFAWDDEPSCTTSGSLKVCEGSFVAFDYRIHGYVGQALDPAWQPESYLLPVHLWLPTERAEALPLLVVGHGLGGDATQAEMVAEIAAELGIATLAVSSPSHGDHPTAVSSDPQAVFTGFFGIDLGAFSIDGFVFRENVRQAAFDKLQALELVRANPDIDGDGAPDVDPTRTAYWGISLGGILGPNFVAMSDVGAAVFSVAGARVISIISEAEDFKTIFELLATVAGGRDVLLRQAPIAQTLIDGADPVSWAPLMIADPIARPDAPPPHVLVQMVMNDTTVPNIATRSLARALDVPQVPAVIVPVDGLRQEPSAPVSANLPAGPSGGLFQFDRVTRRAGQNPVRATHGGVFSGIELIDQVAVFLDSWLVRRAPSIIDPYEANNTPPLP